MREGVIDITSQMDQIILFSPFFWYLFDLIEYLFIELMWSKWFGNGVRQIQVNQ